MFVQTRGSGKSLVLLHGWGLNSGVWEPISHTLCDHFRVTFIDLPGFGRNRDFMPEDYTLEQVSELVSGHIPENSIVMGWSMGGLVAQFLAVQRHPNVSELVMLASTPRFLEGEDWPGIKLPVLKVFEEQLEKDFGKTLDRFLAIQALGSDSARADIKLIREHVQAYPIPHDDALRGGLKLLSNVDLRDQVSNINIPVHRLFGKLDSLVPYRAISQIDAHFTEGEVVVFPKASHAPFISHPDEFATSLLEVLGIQSATQD